MTSSTIDDIPCPACFEMCTVTKDDADIVSYAVCPSCGYELDSSGGPIVSVRQMLDGAVTGPSYNDVDLGLWTRRVAEMIRGDA